MDNYSLVSSEAIVDSNSPLSEYDHANTFLIHQLIQTDVVRSYLTDRNNGLMVGDSVEVGALVYAQRDCIDLCFEVIDSLQRQLPKLVATTDVTESTIIDRWAAKIEGVCQFKVTRRIPTVYIKLRMVLDNERSVRVSREPLERKRPGGYKGGRRERRIGLVLDDTANLRIPNKK